MNAPSSTSNRKRIIISIVVLCLVALAAWLYIQRSTLDSALDNDVSTHITTPQDNLPHENLTANESVTSVNDSVINHVEKLVIAGPMASVSNPLIRMQSNNSLSDIADTIEYRQWRDPNQMRAMVLKGDVDFIALPTNVAANLYNKGADIKLLNVSVWGILYIVSNDKDLSDLSQLKGKELVMPFRGDMPDIILQRLLSASNLEAERDINIRYVANPIAALQMLMTKQADYAVLVEPAVSMALNKSQSMPAKIIAPTLYRSIDLQQEWAKAFNSEPRLPQAGIALTNPKLSPEIINRFISEYNQALQWTKDNPEEAATLVVKEVPMLNEKAVEQSISHAGMNAVSANEAKPELKSFFEQLSQLDSKLIGGKLPDDDFYYQP